MTDPIALARRVPWSRYLALALFAVLPKCPLCVLALLGVLASLGVDSALVRAAGGPWMHVVGIGLLAFVVVSFARKKGPRAAIWAVAGALALWSLKFLVGADSAAVAGVVGLGVALAVASWVLARRSGRVAVVAPRERATAACSCHQASAGSCEEST